MPYPVGAILKRRAIGGIPVISWLFGFGHMGIYIGDGHVVHLWSPTGRHRRYARVRRDSLRTFAQGRKIHLHKTPRDFRHSRAIVAEAIRLLSGTLDADDIPNISAKPPVTSSRALCARCYRANG